MDSLRQARRARGLTQTELAGRLGKPQSYVAKYETGERRLDVVEFARIARAMRADPCDLPGSIAEGWPSRCACAEKGLTERKSALLGLPVAPNAPDPEALAADLLNNACAATFAAQPDHSDPSRCCEFKLATPDQPNQQRQAAGRLIISLFRLSRAPAHPACRCPLNGGGKALAIRQTIGDIVGEMAAPAAIEESAHRVTRRSRRRNQNRRCGVPGRRRIGVTRYRPVKTPFLVFRHDRHGALRLHRPNTSAPLHA